MIVISTQGQSIINCETDKKTYREENYDDDDFIPLAEELGDEIVPIAGDGGSGLRRYSKDGNSLALVSVPKKLCKRE